MPADPTVASADVCSTYNANPATVAATIGASVNKIIIVGSQEGSSNGSTPDLSAPTLDPGGANETPATGEASISALLGGGTDPELRLRIWYIDNPPVGGPFTISMPGTGVFVSQYVAFAAIIGAALGSFNAVAKYENTSSSATDFSIDTTEDGCLVIESFAHSNAGANVNQSHGQTELVDYDSAGFGSQHLLGVASLDAPTLGTIALGMARSAVSNSKCIGLAVAIAPLGGGGGSSIVIPRIVLSNPAVHRAASW